MEGRHCVSKAEKQPVFLTVFPFMLGQCVARVTPDIVHLASLTESSLLSLREVVPSS